MRLIDQPGLAHAISSIRDDGQPSAGRGEIGASDRSNKYGGGTLVYSDKSKTLRLLYTIDTSSHCLPPRTPHPGPQRVLQAELATPSDIYCCPPDAEPGRDPPLAPGRGLTVNR